MTTAIKTAGCPTKSRKTMKTELVCVCGKRLAVSVARNGWFLSLMAVALASKWKLCETGGSERLGDTYPAFCANCHDTHVCQCRDC